jgi:3-demethoxyubiquinol 3-hydroxylase
MPLPSAFLRGFVFIKPLRSPTPHKIFKRLDAVIRFCSWPILRYSLLCSVFLPYLTRFIMPGDIPTPLSSKGPLPGEGTSRHQLAKILRVDQAGEYGATRIYAGQYAVLRHLPCAGVIAQMAEQEGAHLQRFNSLLAQHHIRPTLLHPVWHVLGFALGVGTALLGEKAAMACTVAVEEVIDHHYQQQIAHLPANAHELGSELEQFRQEELHHRDTALAHEATQAPLYPVLSFTIKKFSQAAIWLSERF